MGVVLLTQVTRKQGVFSAGFSSTKAKRNNKRPSR